MRVLILSPEPPPGDVLRSLTSHGVEPVVALPGAEGGSEGLIQFVRVTARGNPADPMDLRWSRKSLRSVVRDVHPDLIHIHGDPWTPTAEAGAAVARDFKIPYVLVGSASVGGPKGITARWQSDRIRNGAAALVGIVRPALDHLVRGISPGVTGVIPTGDLVIPAHPPARGEAHPLVVAVIGRLTKERGVDLLLGALADSPGPWRLLIAGTGPEQLALEAQAQRLGLSSKIQWLGAVAREVIPTLWSEVDVLIAPSRSSADWVEPTGGVVLQAMAHGVAPIVSRSGALPDAVGDAGLIVDENDRAALARAVQSLLLNPERVREIGAAARRRVLAHYTPAAVAERLVEVWEKVAGVIR